MKLPTLPQEISLGWSFDSDGSEAYGYTGTQLIEYARQAAEQMREACAEAATDNVAFNGGGVQMEAHVRQAIRALEIEE